MRAASAFPLGVFYTYGTSQGGSGRYRLERYAEPRTAGQIGYSSLPAGAQAYQALHAVNVHKDGFLGYEGQFTMRWDSLYSVAGIPIPLP